MIIKENKKSAIFAGIAGVVLIILSIIAVFEGYGGSAVFGLFVGVISVLACVKKLLSNNFLEILDDGFVIEKNKKMAKFNFKDIKKIDTKTMESKKNIQVLNIEFKKPYKGEDKFNFLRFYCDKEAVLPDIYEKSFYEITKILKDSLENQKSDSLKA
ncbi:hypothetical protein [Campylobacter geochelonis]|uniref:hypothetical protein n=1 Tax=Campylobacter geochelonis TaxID=1780362 RepID=UPI00077090BA|nr:hypothetical protein [Campylobacter geochelonis]CZE49920.1 molybdate transport repressor [Campylobacter geochelonis]